MRANDENDKYIDFPVYSLIDNSYSDFDTYIHLKDHFILYSAPGYHWLREELNCLIGKGYDSLFVKRQEENKIQMYLSLAQLPHINKDLAPPERIKKVEQIGAKFIECLHGGEITKSCVKKGEELGQSIIDCIEEDISCVKLIGSLADRDYYTYFHSIRVSIYTTAVAIQMGLNDRKHLTEIALGGIFHDIGKKDLPDGIVNKSGPLTDLEWEKMRAHPEAGYKIVEETLLSHISKEIIIHHHEKLDGSGYPHGINSQSLIQEVQIATLTDIFDALTSSRSYQNKRTRYEALDLIKNKLLNKDISSDAFKALVSVLIAD